MIVSTFLITTVGVVGVFLLVAYLRRGTVASVRMGARVHEVETELAPDAAFAQLIRGVGTFQHADSDPATRAILLQTNPTFATWGFFYPISIQPGPRGGSRIRIGIKSKVIQWGPLVTKWHEQCRAACERAVKAELPKARVVS